MSFAARPADTDAAIIPARTACKLEAIVVIISYPLFHQALLLQPPNQEHYNGYHRTACLRRQEQGFRSASLLRTAADDTCAWRHAPHQFTRDGTQRSPRDDI